MTFELDLDWVMLNQQRSFSLKVIVRTHRHTRMTDLSIWTTKAVGKSYIKLTKTPFTRYNPLLNQLNNQPVVKLAEQPAASCKQTFNRLSNRLFNRFGNRFYRVNGVSGWHML